MKAGAPLTPDSPISALRGVGPALAERLERMGLRRVQDLLFHLPSRYQDRRHIHPMASLQPGMEAAVEGEILDVEHLRGRREQWLVRLADGSGQMQLRLFHLHGAMRGQWRRGRRLWCFGELRMGFHGLEMVHPEWAMADTADFQAPQHLTPFYPSTEGITQLHWRRWIAQALPLADQLPDYLQGLLPPLMPSMGDGLRFLHQGEGGTPAPAHPARQRLALEELLAHHLAVRSAGAAECGAAAPKLQGPGALWRHFLQQLPFAPTRAQERVISEIRTDLGRSRPMRRLLQGDVGSGKTLVAAAATLTALEAGYQAAFMAPTEILAEQLRDRFALWFSPLGIGVGHLAGRNRSGERRSILRDLEEGRLAVVTGTQALFQEGVAFARLGLVIIDEQHRFGVEQRRQLQEKGSMPHLLVMTATPIPRTLAMTIHADLDLSVIDELPPGRAPVETVVMPDSRRAELVERMRDLVGAGRQIYWVCPLIEESEILQLRAAEESFAELSAALPNARVGLVHGRLKGAEKAAVMAAFQSGAMQVLVATTVIEVGVDVPNASLMVIEHAERLGLAQLHQLRGRVGRGAAKSTCILLYHPPLAGKARERLRVMRSSQDGFVIARKDMELRGPGEFLGTRQTGLAQMRVADLLRDEALLAGIPDLAERLLARDPAAVEGLLHRWLGGRLGYGQVA